MEITVIIIIGLLQIALFLYNYSKLQVFKEIYPSIKTLRINLADDFVQGIEALHNNAVFKVIISSINKYLSNNKGQVSDYHLIKDIVDRNTDAKEDEINTLIPIPLYLGLVGTMICIVLGLKGLNLASVVDGDGAAMINGINPLLEGVAVAMIASIIGIFLTTVGSLLAKNAIIAVEENKNTFLTWIQAELLPNLSNDTAQTLEKMSNNLAAFNSTFAGNTRDLKDTLSTVTSSYTDLSNILTELNNMKIVQIASANIEVYEKLKYCTDEIGKLGVFLQELDQYHHNTTKAVASLNTFFDKGIEKIDEINLGVENALKRFTNNTITNLDIFQEKFDSQILDVSNAAQRQQKALQEHFSTLFELLTAALNIQNEELLKHFISFSSQIQTATNEQQEIFKQKLSETTALVEELKNLSAIKESVSKFENATMEQNRKIDTLSYYIKELAQVKSERVVQLKMSKMEKIAVITACSILSLAGLSYLLSQIANWVNGLLELL